MPRFLNPITITTPSGSAPLVVNSSTVVSNLNADLLDGQHGSYYAAASSLSNYLPLTGGTLTGGLAGTTGAFSGSMVLGTGSATGSTKLVINGELTAGSVAVAQINGLARIDYIITHNSGSGIQPNVNGQGSVGVSAARYGWGYINALTSVTGSFSGQITSTVATGTAPLVVASTTAVTNLNADLLDGQHGSFYQNAGNLNAGTIPTGRLSGTYPIDITGYAAAVAVSDTRSVATTPQTINRGVVFDFKNNSSNGLNDGGNYFGLMTFRQYGVTTDWSGGLSHQLGFTDNGNIWQRSGSNTTWGSWKKLWDDANDGAGSGLDADLLDGQHGSYYAAASSLANYLPLTGGTLSGTLTIQNSATSSGATPVFSLVIDRQNSTTDGLMLGVDGNADVVIAGNNGAIRLGRMLNGTFTEGAKLDTSGNLSVVGSVTGASFSGAGTGLTGTASSLTAGAVPWSGVTGKPTTLSGYGITDAMYQVDPNGFTQGDIYGSGNMQRLWGTDSVQNLIAFRPPTTVEYTVDGVNWVATTISNDVFDGKVFGKWAGFNMNVGANVGGWTKVRMTWVNFGYHFFSHFTLCHSTNGHSMNFVFYKSDLNGVFGAESYRVNGINSWPGYTFTSHVNVSGWWDTKDVRMEFELIGNNGPNGYPNNAITIGHIGIMGGYSSFNRVFDWDGSRNITLYGTLTVPGAINANGGLSGTTGTFSGAVQVNNDNGVRASYDSGGSYAWLYGYGVEFGRATSYVRPNTNRVASLFVGGPTINSLDWANIDFYSSGRFSLNNNPILHAGNFNSYALPLTGGSLTGKLSINSTGAWNDAQALLTVGSGGDGRIQVRHIWGKSAANNNADHLWLNYQNFNGHVQIGDSGGGNNLYVSGQLYAGGYFGGSLVLHTGNFSSYALPLSGGTLTGNLALNTGVIFNRGSAPSITNIQCSIFNELNGISSAESLNFRAYGGFKWQYWDGSATWMQLTSSGLTINGNNALHAGNYTSYPFVYGDNTTGSVNTFTGEGGVGANAISRSMFFRDNNGQFGALGIHIQHPGSANYAHQIVSSDYGTTELKHRQKNAGTWSAARTILDSGNYNSYAPTLTGTGASGTWGISISGSAVSSTTQSKSDSSTSIATTAFSKWLFATFGTGGTTDWNHVSNTMPGAGTTLLLGSATNGFGASQYYHPVNFEYAGTGGTGNVTQLAVAYGNNGNDLRMRGRYSGTWTSWVQFLNSSNFSSYALPITGGSVTGPVSIIGQTVNGQSHYQWEGATFRNPGDWTASQIIRRDNATAGINGSIPALVLYNNNGGDQTTVGLSFASAEGATGQGNAVALAGIIARKEGAGTVGSWSSGSLTIYVKNVQTRVDALNITSTGTVNALVALQQDGNQVLHAGNYTSYLNNTYLRAAGHPGYNDWNVFGNTAQTVNSIFQENFNIPTSTGSSNFPTNAAYKYGTLVNFGSGSDARAQVYISHAGNDLVFRGGWGTSSWQTWNRCLTDQNYTSYALPLTGGTLTGTLNGTSAYFSGNIGAGVSPTYRIQSNAPAMLNRTAFGVLDINSNGSPNFIKIQTAIPFSYMAQAYTVNIRGFDYDGAQTVDLTVCWHQYTDIFYNPTVSSSGSFAPTVRLARESGNVVICLTWSGKYWPKLYVESVHNYDLQAYSTGWTWVDADITGDKVVTLSYKNDWGGGMTKDTSGNLTVTGSVTGTSFSGAGTGLTGTAASLNIGGNAATATNASQLNGQAASYYLNAGNLNAGTLPSARLSGTYTIDIAGAASSGSRLGLWDGTTYNTGSNTISGTGGRGVNLAPNTYVKQISFEFKNTSFASMGGNYGGLITIAPWDGTAVGTGDPNYQLLFSASAANSTSNPVLRLRAGIDAGWGAWATLIHDANFSTAIPNSGVGAGTYNNVTVNAKGIVTGGSNVSYLTGNQSISITGDATGSGTTSISLTLANSGVGAGTYRSVTVDAKGRVTGGTNPTTFSGYGISDIAYGSTGSRNVWTITDWNQATYQNAHFLSSENTHTNGPTSDYIYGLQTSFHRSGAAYRTQMVTELYSSPVSIWVRNSRDSDVWTTWSKLLHSNNYTDYAPTKTGVGASGSWGINITGSSASCTGNAATATNVAWSGITSKPTTLSGYGITDAINTSATAQTKSGDLTVGGNFVSNGTATVKSNGTRTGTALIKFAQTIGDNYATSFNIDHNLSTGDILVQVVRLADGVIGDFTTSIVAATLNRVTVTFATAPTNSQYRVVVVG